jgi:hypothetical protein
MRHACTPIRAPEPDAVLNGSRVAMPERSSAAGRLAELPSSASPWASRRLAVPGLIPYELRGRCRLLRVSCEGTQ